MNRSQGEDQKNDTNNSTDATTSLIQHHTRNNTNQYIYNIDDGNSNDTLYVRNGYENATSNSMNIEIAKMIQKHKEHRYWWSELKELCIPSVLGYLTYEATSKTTEIITIPASSLINTVLYIPIYIYGSLKDIGYSIVTMSLKEYGYYRNASLMSIEKVIETSVLSLGIPISVLFGIGMYIFVICILQLIKIKNIQTPFLKIEYKD